MTEVQEHTGTVAHVWTVMTATKKSMSTNVIILQRTVGVKL